MKEKIINEILKRVESKNPLLIAIDGRCASGKTTMGESLKQELFMKGKKSTLIHIDEFFLRPEQRTKERLSTAGENIDHERFLEKVLIPIKENKEIKYQPFDCSVFALVDEKTVKKEDIIIIEGSYSLNKNLIPYYDLKIFMTSTLETRKKRILKRNGEKMLQTFLNRWIPMEEMYFEAYNIESKCDFVIET